MARVKAKAVQTDFPVNAELVEYYREAQSDYGFWSAGYNMHFGFYKWGLNPFNLESMLRQMNVEVMSTLDLDGTEKLADLGCGTGATARVIASSHPDCQIDALTLVPSQMKLGNEMNKQVGVQAQITFHRQNFNHTDFAPDTFNKAYAVESACYAPGPAKTSFLNEAFRILKPGGRLVIADAFRKQMGKLPVLQTKAYKMACEAWLIPSMTNLIAIQAEMKHIGFANIQVRDISLRVAPSVVHVPFKVVGFLLREFVKTRSFKLSRHRRNNLIAPMASVVLGLSRKHFAYCIISAEKPM